MTGHLFRAWRFAAGVIVLLIVLVGVDPAAVGSALMNADVTLVLVGVIGLTAVHLVPAAGWRAIHGRTSGRWLPWRRTIALFYAAQAIGGVTPANLGGDVHRAAALRRSGQQWDAAVAPLLVQRATSYLALSAIAIAAAAFLAVRAPMAAEMSLAGAVVAVLVAVAAWLLVTAPGKLRGLRDRLIGAPSDALGGLGAGAAIGMGTGLVFHAAAIGFTGLLVLAVDPTVPIMPVLAAVAVARLALAVPITPSGLGVQEGILAVLFAALGIASGVALAGMLLARLALVLTTVIGVVALIRSRRSSEPTASRGKTQSFDEDGGEDGPARASSTHNSANPVRG